MTVGFGFGIRTGTVRFITSILKMCLMKWLVFGTASSLLALFEEDYYHCSTDYAFCQEVAGAMWGGHFGGRDAGYGIIEGR